MSLLKLKNSVKANIKLTFFISNSYLSEINIITKIENKVKYVIPKTKGSEREVGEDEQ